MVGMWEEARVVKQGRGEGGREGGKEGGREHVPRGGRGEGDSGSSCV